MSKPLRWVLLIILLLVGLTLIVFMLENRQSVIINFFGWSTGEVSISSCLVIALLVGMVIGPVLAFMLKSRRVLRNKRIV